jgi:hypothetical protein
MAFLLDTNVVSELTKEKPDPRCRAWLQKHGGGALVSVITLAELCYGVARLPEGKRRNNYERALRFLMEDYHGRFVDFDGPPAVEWGSYAAELEWTFGADWWKTFDFRDTQNGAIARAYGLTIATRNVKHFPGCDTINPWEFSEDPSSQAATG